MRVLLDCRMASWSGVGRYVTGLARALAARADVELVEVCAAGETPPAAPGFLVRAVSANRSPLSLRGAAELGTLISEVKPDLVHCPQFPTPWPIQVPLVVTLQDLIPLTFTASMPSAVKRLVYRLWNARAADAADRLIVPSQATARDVGRFFPSAQGKVSVTPYAVDDFSTGAATALTGRLAEPASGPYLLAMGNTRPHKGIPTLLRAFGILAPSFPDLRLLLVGEEPVGYLQHSLRGVPPEMAERIAFTGRVTDEQLRTLYGSAVAFICPSHYEGFGFPPLEAMALGAPVVCAQATSLPEVVGNAALLFPPGEQGMLATTIAHLLRDPVRQRELSLAGRAQAARFSWQDTATATVHIYTEVLRERDASSAGWVET